MTNIQAKANELYPVRMEKHTYPPYTEFDANRYDREKFISNVELYLSTLSGTDKEAEEVLKPYLQEGEDANVYFVSEYYALKAMQDYAASRVAKESKIAHDYWWVYVTELEEKIQSLQQQISEKEGLYLNMKGQRDTALNEVDRLTAEVERLKEAAKELVHLHGCEQEGLSSGRPTAAQWLQAVDNLSNLVYP